MPFLGADGTHSGVVMERAPAKQFVYAAKNCALPDTINPMLE